MPTLKAAPQKSEAWLSFIVVVSTLLTAYMQHAEGLQVWIALGTTIALTGVYAFYNTGLASQDRPGWKTPGFRFALGSVALSVITAVAEFDIPGLPPKVTQFAAMLAAALTAAGYNVWRFKVKAGLPPLPQEPDEPAEPTPVTAPLDKKGKQ